MTEATDKHNNITTQRSHFSTKDQPSALGRHQKLKRSELCIVFAMQDLSLDMTPQTYLGGSREAEYEAHGADPECDGALPAPQSCRPDGDDALDDGVEDSEALGDSQEDKDEVEEHRPERRDHFGPEESEVSRYELRGEPVDLVAALHDGVPLGGDDPDPGQVADVVVLSRTCPGFDGGVG